MNKMETENIFIIGTPATCQLRVELDMEDKKKSEENIDWAIKIWKNAVILSGKAGNSRLFK